MPLNFGGAMRPRSLSLQRPGFGGAPMAPPAAPTMGAPPPGSGGLAGVGPALGGLFGGNPGDPAANKPEHMKGTLGGKAVPLVNEVAGPEAIAGDVQKLFQLLQSSPAFAQMLRGISQTGSQRNTAIQSALGRTGLSGTGVGAIGGALGSSATSNAIGQARGQLFSDAMNTALEALLARLSALPAIAGHYASRTGEGFKPGRFIEAGVGAAANRYGGGGSMDPRRGR